jgi:hypothetical protein
VWRCELFSSGPMAGCYKFRNVSLKVCDDGATRIFFSFVRHLGVIKIAAFRKFRLYSYELYIFSSWLVIRPLTCSPEILSNTCQRKRTGCEVAQSVSETRIGRWVSWPYALFWSASCERFCCF